MDIKLIGIDIDGTLVNDQKQIPKINRSVIAKAKAQGIKIVICTGRPLSGAQPILKRLHISGPDEYVITFNGSLAQQADGKVLDKFELSYDNYLITEALSRKYGVNFQIETPNAIYALNRNISKYTVFEAKVVQLPLCYRTPEEIKPDLPISKTMWIGEPDKITNLKRHLPDYVKKRMYIVQTEPVFLEALHKGVSKGRMLLKLATQLGLKPENVMAMGDQGNDLSMIKKAGLGVAMGNAIDEDKQAAQFVTKDNNDGGVAYAIRKFALK